MKIVHIMLCGPVTDGWNYQDNLLTKYHAKLGYDVSMITSQWIWNSEGNLELFTDTDYINQDNAKVIRLPIQGGKTLSYKFKRYPGLYDSIKEENPDILFIHGVAFLDIGTIVKYLKKNKNIKVYVDNHSDFSNSATNWVSKNILHKIIWRYNAQKINRYVTKFYGVLPARVEFLTDIYKLPKEKCELLLMGADDEKVDDAKKNAGQGVIRKKYGIKDNDFLIVSGGKIDNAKKQTLLLMEAVSQIERKNLKLIVFGSVEDSLKESVDRLSDNERIIYAGWVDAADSYNYFAAANLVVFPGRHSVFWEQVVGQGIPLMCKRWDGTTHVDIGGNIIFLKEDSVAEIRENIEVILEHGSIYMEMLRSANKDEHKRFLYSEIARCSIET